MAFSVRRLFIQLSLVLVFIAAVLFGASYYIMTKMAYKASYSEKLTKKIKAERELLKKVHNARDVTFTTEDGIDIAGLLMLRENAKRNVIVCHGYKGAKELNRQFVTILPKDNILFFDFRAHGQSGGDLITVGYCEKKDVQAAVQFLKSYSETKGLPVCGVGLSMGAASLIGAAADGAPFEALILDSSFARLDDHLNESFTMRSGMPRFPFMTLAKFLFGRFAGFDVVEHNPCVCVCDIACPVFMIHSQDDTVISVDHFHKLYERAPEKKLFWLVPSAIHGLSSRSLTQEYAKRANAFFDAVVV